MNIVEHWDYIGITLPYSLLTTVGFYWYERSFNTEAPLHIPQLAEILGRGIAKRGTPFFEPDPHRGFQTESTAFTEIKRIPEMIVINGNIRGCVGGQPTFYLPCNPGMRIVGCFLWVLD